MSVESDGVEIGYSIFDASEECWLLNENACFIASTESAAREFLSNDFAPADACRIQTVSFADIMRDFGCTGGQYAIERDAFERFEKIAKSNSVRFEFEPYDGDDTLLVVDIEGVKSDDE